MVFRPCPSCAHPSLLLDTHCDLLTRSSTTLPLPRSLPNLGETPCQWTALLASLNPCAHDAVYLDSQTSPMLASFMFSHNPLPSHSVTSAPKQSPHRSCFVSSWAVLSDGAGTSPSPCRCAQTLHFWRFFSGMFWFLVLVPGFHQPGRNRLIHQPQISILPG